MQRLSVVALWVAFFTSSTFGQAAPAQKAESPPRKPAANRLAPTHADLAYGPHDRQRLDLYLPEKAGGAAPLILFVHGGGWIRGDKSGAAPQTPRLVSLGFAVASIDYRLSGDAIFPAQIFDCKAAVRFLRANAAKYNLDPERFAAYGSSAGGHLVALLGTSGDVKELEGDVGDYLNVSSRVQLVCDLFGPVALLKMQEQTPEEAWSKPNSAESPESQLIGGPIQENKEKTEKSNPINYISTDDPPFLIVHGDADDRVPIQQSVMLQQALEKAGIPCTLISARGGTHKANTLTPTTLKAVEQFFCEHLLKKPAN